MNIQIKRFGVPVKAYSPAIPQHDVFQISELFTDGIQFNPEPPTQTIRVCVYLAKGDEIPTSFIKSEQDLTNWVIEHKGQRYECKKSKQGNSELYKTVIVPLNERDLNVNLDAVAL